METFKTITDELAAVTGGIDWQHAHQQGKDWARYYAGVAHGRPVGTTLGLLGGYVGGVGKGVYDTWD